MCRTQKIPRHHTSKSHLDAAREDLEWEDSKLYGEQQGFRKGRWKTEGMFALKRFLSLLVFRRQFSYISLC